MDLEALHLAVEVADRGSFAAVARDRDTDPSAISRAIAALEEQLGFRLFERSTRRLAATEAGGLYLERSRALIEQLEGARDEARALTGEPSGTLRLTASVAFGVTRIVPLLPSFRAAYPRITIEMILSDDNLALIADRIDLAIRLAPAPREDVIGVKLMPTRYHVVAAPSYIARSGLPRDPSELAKHRCLLFALPEFRARWLFRGASGAVETVPVAGDIVVSNALALHAIAREGLGPALLPDWLAGPDLRSGDLTDLFPDHQVTATAFDTAAWILYPSRAFLPVKTRVAIDFFRANLRVTDRG